MPQPIQFRFRTLSRRTGWLPLIAALTVMILIGLLLAVVAVGILIILLPALIVTGIIYYVFPRARVRSPRGQTANQPTIIDGEFHIVEPRKIEYDSSRHDLP